MPLQQECKSCGRMLVLEEVFQGARCRCKHCHSLIEIRPASTSARRTTHRPDNPREINAANSVRNIPGSVVAPSASAWRGVLKRFSTVRLVASFVFVSSGLIGIVVWNATGSLSDHRWSSNTASETDDAVSVADEPTAAPTAAENPRLAIAASDPRRSYFGIPLQGGVVGYVIDGDASMAPHIDRVAFVTNSVNTLSANGDTRFGIVQAVENPDGARFYEVFEPSTDLAGARTMMHARLASGVTDLPRAFAVTEGWYADEIFLVLSKVMPPSEIDYLAQLAQQSGATTHVIALGDAAADTDLAMISDATHGQFVPVSDDAMNDLVRMHEALALPGN